jgi:hypothetical protein
MSKVTEYRGLAAKLRREAEDASLPHLRITNLAAAERWEALADELDRARELTAKPLPRWIL